MRKVLSLLIALFFATATLLHLSPTASAAGGHDISWGGDITANEGNAGTTMFTFTVQAIPPPSAGETISVTYATLNGTATVADNDYVPASDTVQLTSMASSQSVTILVNGDTKVEPNETFQVSITGAASNQPGTTLTMLGGTTATGNITNDDGSSVGLAIADAPTITEGDSGTSLQSFVVTMTGSSGTPVTVNFATTDGTATAPSDYLTKTGTLTFFANQPTPQTQTINVDVVGDTTGEPPTETYFVTLSAPVGATISDAVGQGQITDNDAGGLSINDVSQLEGNSGTSSFNFTVSLAPAQPTNVTVAFATANGTAIAPGDYTTQSGSLTFTPGQTAKTVTVPVVGDTVGEADETFAVNLSGAGCAGICTAPVVTKSQGVGTIKNDDGASPSPSPSTSPSASPSPVTPKFAISDVSGATTSSDCNFTVTLTPTSASTVSVNFASQGGEGQVTPASGTLTFTAGQSSKSVVVDVTKQKSQKGSVDVTLTGQSAGTSISKATGTCTIKKKHRRRHR